jgi:glycosyltransferase involved in cell wall biosynthesis
VSRKVRESSLFSQHRIESIPLPIDASLFRPFEQRVARDLLHVPADKKVIFFGATYLEEARKGMAYLVEALQQLRALTDDTGDGLRADDIFLLVAGSNGQKILDMLPFAGRATGQLQDELLLALAYQSADVFVCPSVEDAGPMMIPEAMMCGTPVVAFNAGGAPDLVETMKTGYLANDRDSGDFANGMRALLSLDCLSEMRLAARTAAARAHTPALVAERYTRLYSSLRES